MRRDVPSRLYLLFLLQCTILLVTKRQLHVVVEDECPQSESKLFCAQSRGKTRKEMMKKISPSKAHFSLYLDDDINILRIQQQFSELFSSRLIQFVPLLAEDVVKKVLLSAGWWLVGSSSSFGLGNT